MKYLGTGLKKELASFSVLCLPPEVRQYGWRLGEDYCLSLCTADEGIRLEQLHARQLLKNHKILETVLQLPEKTA